MSDFAFQQRLREHFGTTPPIGFCLRADHSQRWLRLHSLPQSKRYAETDVERTEVRRRAWAAASEVLPTGAQVWLTVTGYSPQNAPSEVRLPSMPSLRFEPVAEFNHRLLAEASVVFAARTTWPHAHFGQVIDLIARDELRLVWLSSVSGEVFAPYDGGIDLILESAPRREALRRSFPADWFSSREDGL